MQLGDTERGRARGAETSLGTSWGPVRSHAGGGGWPICHGEDSGDGELGGSLELWGRTGKPRKTEGPASYGDNSEFRRVRKIWGCLRSSPSPCTLVPGPRSHSTPHPAQAREKGVGAAIPEDSRSQACRQAEKASADPPAPLHLSPEFPLHTPSARDLGSGGRLSWKRFPPPWLPLLGFLGEDFGANRPVPTPTCGDQCRGREEQQQKPEPGRRRRRRHHSRCRRTLGSARQHSTRHVGHLPQTGGGGRLRSPSGQLMRC